MFETEAAMCAAFMGWAREQGWTPYPEWADFDILLVHGDGTQIGIQAKLKFNLAVLAQIAGSTWMLPDKVGPDYLAILVPECPSPGLCAGLGVAAFTYGRHGKTFIPALDVGRRSWEPWHYRNPEQRCPLPRFVPDVQAGASGPTRLTEWKLAALAIAATIDIRGYVTRDDFRLHRIDHRRWTQDWLVPCEGAAGRWVRGPLCPDFAAQHPVIYPQVRAEEAERLALNSDLLV